LAQRGSASSPLHTSNTDRVVPHKENSELVYDHYKALDGPVERVVKPGGDHHQHGLTEPRPIVDFFDRAWQSRK
jgi:hypothetical protein